MTFVTRKRLPRRTLLRGVGTAIALPWLDAMKPAFAAAGEARPPVRMLFGYVPNGIIMRDWTPKRHGKDFEFTRILKPLEPFREEITVISGLAHRTGEGPAGDHARAGGTFLTGVCPKRTTSADVEVGISVDQVAAQAVGAKTRLPSLELGCEATRMVGSCDAGYSCAYINSMSWRSATTPNPPETNPRAVFERLYGSLDTAADPAVRARLEGNRRSVLDYVNQQTRDLASSLGPSDRRKIDEYLAAIRDIEKRIARAESDPRDIAPPMEKPGGVPFGFEEHVRLMHDLLTVALHADLTRIATLIYAKEGSTRSYPELGFSDPHHPLTHHRNNEEWIEKVTRINCHHLAQFAYFVGRLKTIQEGDGTLLDHSMIVYGSSISDGNIHWHKDLPVLLAGRGGGLKPGRHLALPETPMTNLYLTMLDRMGVRVDKLGDSEGRLEQVAV